ncbi:unnamed protein product [Lasius platythorax]|uniref:FHA domain-containing protein n=1 Tax=Lasius platythorax TaxID=488582 RepID=A0AAV2NMJ8_9HYME
MEHSKRLCDKMEPKVILMRIDDEPHVHINKNEFKIGCARYDEIISDTAISREHRCKGDNKWKLEETQGNKDLNDSITLISDTAVFPEVMQNVSSGDIIQFSPNEKFKYTFTLVEREHCVQKACIEKAVYHILVKQKAFAASQECERKEVKDTIQVKQKEEDALRQVSDLLQQSVAKNDEDLLKKIAMLEGKVQISIDERLQYEKSMNEEKQKWQKTLHMRKRQIKMFKRKMQKLRKLQVQEKKMRRKVKILETRFKELEKGLSDHKIIKEISEKCTTKLLTQFNEFFESVKLSENELDVTDLTEYMKIKRILLNPIALADSSSVSSVSPPASSFSSASSSSDEVDEGSKENIIEKKRSIKKGV